MPERPNGTVSKTVVGASSPGVQIPPLPPFSYQHLLQYGVLIPKLVNVGTATTQVIHNTYCIVVENRRHIWNVVLHHELFKPHCIAVGARHRPRRVHLKLGEYGPGIDKGCKLLRRIAKQTIGVWQRAHKLVEGDVFVIGGG